MHCLRFLDKNIKTKGYKIKNIIYSTRDGRIVKKKFKFLLDNTSHISRGIKLYKIK